MKRSKASTCRKLLIRWFLCSMFCNLNFLNQIIRFFTFFLKITYIDLVNFHHILINMIRYIHRYIGMTWKIWFNPLSYVILCRTYHAPPITITKVDLEGEGLVCLSISPRICSLSNDGMKLKISSVSSLMIIDDHWSFQL